MLDRLKHLIRRPAPSIGVVPKDYIRKFLPPNPVVVEAGAHAGHDTVTFARQWKGAEIHAFEPVPSLWKALCQNTAGHGNVYCYPLALAEGPGWSWCDLNLSEGASNASSSVLPPKEHLQIHPDVHFLKKIRAPSVSLDAWAEQWCVPRIDFLWLDLQGLELQVLKGGQTALKNVSALYCEVNLIENYEGASLYPVLRTWLEQQGFKVEREELPWKDSGNVLFIRNAARIQ